MDLRQLRYFVAIVEQGSFSKAAEQLLVAQPALSQHIRHMEDELGVVLLHRKSRGVLPTEAGERLLTHAKKVLAEFAEIAESVRGVQTTPAGGVRYGLPGTVSELLGVPLIEAVRTHYPNVHIRIAEAMSGFILDWLRRGDIDLAVIYSTSDPKGLVIHHALTEELCLFGISSLSQASAPPGGIVDFSDAAKLDLVLPGPRHGLRNLIDETAHSADVPINPAIEIDSYAQIKRLVKRGFGYGILPRVAVQQEEEGGIFQTWRLANPPLYRKVYLAYSNDRPLPIAVKAIGQLSWDILRRLVKEDLWPATLTDESHSPRLYP